jgi:hypothetical protein
VWNNSYLATLNGRAYVGTTTQYGVDVYKLYSDGPIGSSWNKAKCTQPALLAAITADGAAPCFDGNLSYQIDTGTTNTLTTAVPSATTDFGTSYFRTALTVAGAANNGMGLFFGAGVATVGGNWLSFASNTPIFQASWRIQYPNATSGRYYIGFTNVNMVSNTFETVPTRGAWFEASSTQANLRAVCANDSGVTYASTNVASTSVITGTTPGAFRHLMIIATSTNVMFLSRPTLRSNWVVEANCTTNVSRENILVPGIHTGWTTAPTLNNLGFHSFNYELNWTHPPSL